VSFFRISDGILSKQTVHDCRLPLWFFSPYGFSWDLAAFSLTPSRPAISFNVNGLDHSSLPLVGEADAMRLSSRVSDEK
jgi:hypothetical protein